MKVLSTTNSTFVRRQIPLMAAMSLRRIKGLVGVSIYTSRVFLRIARSTFPELEVST